MKKNEIKKINVKSSLDLLLKKLMFILLTKLGISFDEIDVKRGTIAPRLNISKKTKITVKATNIFARKKRLFGKNLKIFSNLFNL